MGDEARLQQAVWNLLINSVKYTPQGGTVGVAAGRADAGAFLRIRDSGEGIDPDFLPFIFEPFRQGQTSMQRSGLGLGLALVRRLVELHGGQITAASQGRGSGAEFVMTLPIASQGAADAVPVVSLHILRGLRVLLTEDDVDSAASVAAILAQRGCESRTAYTAGECLRILAEWMPDVMLCDVGLPDDDGYNLLRRIRALPQASQVPAIALTAYSSDDDKAKALAAGFRTHMSKPLQPELLLREISAAAGGRIGRS
jgi:CheY-like chemotaxis protein